MTLGQATLNIKPEIKETDVNRLKKTLDGVGKGLKGIGGGLKSSFNVMSHGMQIFNNVIAGLDKQIGELKETAEFAGSFSQLAAAGGVNEGQLVALQKLFIDQGAGNPEQVNQLFSKFLMAIDSGKVAVDENKTTVESFLNYLNNVSKLEKKDQGKAIFEVFGRQSLGAKEMLSVMPELTAKLKNLSPEELAWFKRTGENTAKFDNALDRVESEKLMAKFNRTNILADKGMDKDLVTAEQKRSQFDVEKAGAYELGSLQKLEEQKINMEKISLMAYQAQIRLATTVDRIIKEGNGSLKGIVKIFVDEMIKGLGLDKFFSDLIESIKNWRPWK